MARTKKQPATTFEKETIVLGSENPPPEVTIPAPETPAPGAPEPAATEVPPPKPPRRGRKAASAPDDPGSVPAAGLTMRGLSDGFIAALQAKGAGLGTVFSYHLDLNLAVRHFGPDTAVASLTPRRVENFNTSDAVTKTRSGRQKAAPGISKSIRVLRLALTWALENKLIETLPVPESAMPRRGKKESAA